MLAQELKERKLTSLYNKSINESTAEECTAGCRKAAEVRNKMGGAMHYNILNEECHILYDACREKGVEQEIMTELYGLLK